jgi:phospho-N-acetylmuramoyl-pentapeptide-transferase
MNEFSPVRPDISLPVILTYAFVAFVIALIITPRFVAFLRYNKIGKQLRVETVDGREPTVFRKYHESKWGTPTMGGLLIWGSILVAVIISRLLSLFGYVESSLLQRGQVYLPLFMMVTLGVLGGIDDYINVVGSDERKVKRVMQQAYGTFFALSPIALPVIFYLSGVIDSTYGIPLTGFGMVLLPVLLLAMIVWLSVAGIVVGDVIQRIRGRASVSKGLGVLPKVASLLLLTLFAALWFHLKLGYSSVHVPFWGDIVLGWWYVPLFMFVIIGTANGVNFSDGLDGLCAGLLTIAFTIFGIIAYVKGLDVLAAFCAVSVGAIVAFLWHNVPPALFFMGDTGSLALGGVLAVIAMMIDQVLILPLVGFVFLIETLSVIIQLSSKKLRGGKKVFIAAPIHHHFEALDWGESKVTMRLWIVGGFFAMIGLIVGILG